MKRLSTNGTLLELRTTVSMIGDFFPPVRPETGEAIVRVGRPSLHLECRHTWVHWTKVLVVWCPRREEEPQGGVWFSSVLSVYSGWCVPDMLYSLAVPVVYALIQRIITMILSKGTA